MHHNPLKFRRADQGLFADRPFVLLFCARTAAVLGSALVVLWETTMQREIPKESLSRVSSYDALGSLMLMPVGLLLAGPSIGWIGVNAALLLTAAVTVLATIGAICSPGVRKLEWSAPQPGAPAGDPERDVVQLDRNQPSQTAPRPRPSVDTTLIDA